MGGDHTGVVTPAGLHGPCDCSNPTQAQHLGRRKHPTNADATVTHFHVLAPPPSLDGALRGLRAPGGPCVALPSPTQPGPGPPAWETAQGSITATETLQGDTLMKAQGAASPRTLGGMVHRACGAQRTLRSPDSPPSPSSGLHRAPLLGLIPGITKQCVQDKGRQSSSLLPAPPPPEGKSTSHLFAPPQGSAAAQGAAPGARTVPVSPPGAL